MAAFQVRGLAVLAVLPSPSPSPGGGGLRSGLTADQVTPGLLGFLMTAFMVIAVILLMVSMTRRIRRVRYRGQLSDGAEPGEAADAGPPSSGLSTDSPGVIPKQRSGS